MFLVNANMLNTVMIIIWVLLAIALILYVWRTFFTPSQTLEPEDPQALIDSEFQKRDDSLNELINHICMIFEVNAEQLQTNSYQSDLDTMTVKIGFDNMMICVVSNWSNKTYEVQLMHFNTNVAAKEVVNRAKKVFKMDKNTLMADYTKVSAFVVKFIERINAQTTTEDMINEVAQIIHSPELKDLSQEQLNTLLYTCAQNMSELLTRSKFRRSKGFILTYSQLMAYICASGKADEMVKYLKQEVDESESSNQEEE